jgi:hypothetical protein
MGDGSNFNGIVDATAKVLPLAIALAFCASVLHEIGFLYKLELSYNQVSYGYGDITRSAIGWLPLALSSMASGVLIGWLTSRLSQGQADESSQYGGQLSKRNRTGAFEISMWGISVASFLTIIFLGEVAISGLSMSLAMPFLAVSVRRSVKSTNDKDLIGARNLFLTSAMLMLLPLPFMSGYSEAFAYIAAPKFVDRIELSESGQLLVVEVLRSLDSGYLVLMPNGKIHFLAASSVSSIAYSHNRRAIVGVLCWAIGNNDYCGVGKESSPFLKVVP